MESNPLDGSDNKKMEQIGIRLSPREKKLLKEKSNREEKSMSRLVRTWINQNCNPMKSVEKIDNEIEEIKEKMEKKKKEKIEELEEKKQRLKERKEVELEYIEEFRDDFLDLVSEIYKRTKKHPVDVKKGKFSRDHCKSIEKQIHQKDEFEGLSIRNRKEFFEKCISISKNGNHPDKVGEEIFEECAERGIFSLKE